MITSGTGFDFPQNIELHYFHGSSNVKNMRFIGILLLLNESRDLVQKKIGDALLHIKFFLANHKWYASVSISAT